MVTPLYLMPQIIKLYTLSKRIIWTVNIHISGELLVQRRAGSGEAAHGLESIFTSVLFLKTHSQILPSEILISKWGKKEDTQEISISNKVRVL